MGATEGVGSAVSGMGSSVGVALGVGIGVWQAAESSISPRTSRTSFNLGAPSKLGIGYLLQSQTHEPQGGMAYAIPGRFGSSSGIPRDCSIRIVDGILPSTTAAHPPKWNFQPVA